jgi:hypothetical protein
MPDMPLGMPQLGGGPPGGGMSSPGVTGVPQPGSTPVASPSGNPGDEAMALSRIREAVKILQGVLPNLQIGTPPYDFITKTLTGAGKIVPPSNEIPGQQQTTLKGLANDAQKSAVMQSLIRSMGADQGGGASAGPTPGGAPMAA